ncbi:MAG: DUF2163 domain-containing protein [Alphaproteobacteria bacterium]
MKNLSPALQAHLGTECSTAAFLVKITRTDGVVRAFTNHDRDLVVGGVTYKADGAFNPSALVSDDKLATDNLAMTGILNSTDVTEADLDAGRYDHARVDVYIVNWADLSQGVMQLRRGWLGEVTLQATHYMAELRGLHDLLQREWGDYYTAECRHDLGDARCGIALGVLTVSGSVTAAADAAHCIDTARGEADGWFNYGKLQWTSGANSGLAVEVKQWDAVTRQFTLWLPMPQPIAVGDAYTVIAGCDKRYATCKSKFSNLIRFGGFPHMPGVDRILHYPDGKI